MSIPASRWWHLHWREHLTDQQFTRDPRLWLLVDHIALTTDGKDPEGTGSTVSQTTLAEVTGYHRETLARKVDDLERRGVLLVKRFDVPIRNPKGGRPGHRYLLPPFLTSREVKSDPERENGPNPQECYGGSPAQEPTKAREVKSDQEGGYVGSWGGYVGSPAHDPAGRVLKGLEGGDARAGAREDTPLPPPSLTSAASTRTTTTTPPAGDASIDGRATRPQPRRRQPTTPCSS